MNIDSPHLMSLLSSVDSSRNTSSEIPANLPEGADLSGTFLEKLKQLSSLMDSDNRSENATIPSLNEVTQQHKLAGLLSDMGVDKEVSQLFGNHLPLINQLGEGINLDNTFSALADVMMTLDSAALKTTSIVDKINGLVDKLELIKLAKPEQLKQLTGIIKELQTIQQLISKHKNVFNLHPEEGAKDSGLIPRQKKLIQPGMVNHKQSADSANVSSVQDSSTNLGLPTSKNERVTDDKEVAGQPENYPQKTDSKNSQDDPLSEQIDQANAIVEGILNDQKISPDVHRSEQTLAILSDRQDNPVSSVEKDTELIDHTSTEKTPKEIKVSSATEPTTLVTDPAVGKGTELVDHTSTEKTSKEIKVSSATEPVSITSSVLDPTTPQLSSLTIDHLEQMVATIEKTVSDKLNRSNQTNVAKVEKPVSPPVGEKNLSEAKVNDNLSITDQIQAAISSLDGLNKQKQTDGGASLPLQPINTTTKQGDLSVKQLPGDQVTASPIYNAKQQDQQNSQFQQQSRQLQALLLDKQSENSTQLENKGTESGHEKNSTRFITDLNHFSRTILPNNKTDIPPMTRHFSSPEWPKEMGERIIWMHKQAIPSAELRLNPAHLGPVTIKLNLSQDQATIAFTAQHAAVKEAIEASLPRLRDMFSAQQINLTDVNVSQDDNGQKQAKNFNSMAGQNSGQQKNNPGRPDYELPETNPNIIDEIEAGREIASNGILSIFA